MILYILQTKELDQKWPYQYLSSDCRGLLLEDFLLAPGQKDRGSGLRDVQDQPHSKRKMTNVRGPLPI